MVGHNKRREKKRKDQTMTNNKLWKALTDRERQTAILVAQGYSRDEAAEEMSISIKTFDHHRLQVLHKLDLATSIALVWFCLQHGILAPNAKVL